VVQIRLAPKTRNPFTIGVLSISGVSWKWRFLNHALGGGCQREVARVRGIAAEGTNADCQLSTFAKARAQGLPEREALGAVVDWLAQATAGQQASSPLLHESVGREQSGAAPWR